MITIDGQQLDDGVDEPEPNDNLTNTELDADEAIDPVPSSCANLHAFLAASLPTSEADAFRAHLPNCATCQREMSTTLQLDALVSEATHADKERIRETLRPLLRVACRRAVNRPGEIDKAINDTLSGEGESLVAALATSEAARVAAEERARVLGEALAAAKSVIDAGNRWAVDGTNSQRRVELREALFAYKLAARSLPAAPAEEPTK